MVVPASIAQLLEKNQGVVFADEHDDPAITRYIAAQMPHLAKAGVKVLFVEMMRDSQPHRELLSQFNQRADTLETRKDIQEWLESCSHYPPRTAKDYFELFEAARDAGVAVIGIEPATRNAFRPIASSNAAWVNTIREYLAANNNPRYAAFGGRLHTHTANQNAGETEADQAEGIDKQLGVPAITFTHSTHAKQPLLRAGAGVMDYSVVLPEGPSAIASISF